MENKPKISVLIPINDNNIITGRLPNLMRCLESLIYQSYENIEILIISPIRQESIYECIKELCNQNKDRMQIHLISRDSSIVEVIRVGLEASSGEYISIIDVDVMLEYHALYSMSEIIRDRQQVDCVYAGYKLYEEGTMLQCVDKRSTSEMHLQYILKGDLALFNKLIRRNILQEITTKSIGETILNTYEIVLRILFKCEQYISCNEVLYHYIPRIEVIRYRLEKDYVLDVVNGVERTIAWINQQEPNEGNSPQKQVLELDAVFWEKREYIFARMGVELVRLFLTNWVYANIIIRLISKYKNIFLRNEVFQLYSATFKTFQNMCVLSPDKITRNIYTGTLLQPDVYNQVLLKSNEFFTNYGRVTTLNEELNESIMNPYIKKIYETGDLQLVQEYLIVKVLVEKGGFYVSPEVQLLHPLDGLCCFESVVCFEDEYNLLTGLIGARKGHPLWKMILKTYETNSEWNQEKINLAERVRLCLIGNQGIHFKNCGTFMKEGILILSPNQCVIPHVYKHEFYNQLSLCYVNYLQSTNNNEYITLKKSTLQYLLNSSCDERMITKLRSSNVQLKKRLDGLLTSRSIRLTKPLRICYRRIKNWVTIFNRS